MSKPRSQLERRFSRSAAIVLLLLTGYVFGGPIVYNAAARMLPSAEPFTRVVYAPLMSYAFGSDRLPGANWYESYWVLCDHLVDKYD